VISRRDRQKTLRIDKRRHRDVFYTQGERKHLGIKMEKLTGRGAQTGRKIVVYAHGMRHFWTNQLCTTTIVQFRPKNY
jgi:hypothetical protein